MKHDIEHLLKNMEIPEPDERARETTIKAAVHEFNRKKCDLQENTKGINNERRLTVVLQIFSSLFGGRIMKRPFVFAGGLTAFLAVIGFCLSCYIFFGKKIVQETAKPTEIVVAQNDLTNRLNGNDIINLEAKSPSVAKRKTEKDNIPLKKHSTELKFQMLNGFNNAAISPMALDSRDHILQEYKDTGRDKFDTITTNPIKKVNEEPVSTFSIDVDTSSYTFVRRQLNNGQLPQKNAVRVEEMINYFDYNYPVPDDKSIPFKPTIALFQTPWNDNTKLLHIGIKGYDIGPEKKTRANLVFLIDVSGSMNSEDKLPLLKNSLRLLVNSLDEDDTIALVVYAGSAGTVLEPTKIKDKGKILTALDNLRSGGSTAGGQGIKSAYALAEANFDKNSVNRVILATDGDFNVGIRNPEELKSLIERKRDTGIFLSVLGFGQGNYNDALMQKLAQNGNGNASYIDNLNEARKVLVDEATSTLFTIAKDVKIQVEFNPKLVSEYRLIGYESRMLKREDFNNDKVDAGDVGSGHSVTAIYELTPSGNSSKFIDELRYANKKGTETITSTFDQEYAFLKIRYKLPDSNKSQLINRPITTENEYNEFIDVPSDQRFATAVAAFGQILRGGAYIGEFGYDDVIRLADSATSKDKFGYRHEFINLVRLAKSAR